jgi:hypothetical protein
MHKYLPIIKKGEQAQLCIYKGFICLFVCLCCPSWRDSLVSYLCGVLYAQCFMYVSFRGIVKWTYNVEVMLLHQHVLSQVLRNGLWHRSRFSATTAKLLGHGLLFVPVFITNRNVSYVRAFRRHVGYPYVFSRVSLALPCKWRISFRIVSNSLFICISAVPSCI